MPTLAIVDGVRIVFYWNAHPPPHFHAEFSGHKGQFSIATSQLIEGSLPPAKVNANSRWAASRRLELMECWDKARQNVAPGKVE